MTRHFMEDSRTENKRQDLQSSTVKKSHCNLVFHFYDDHNGDKLRSNCHSNVEMIPIHFYQSDNFERNTNFYTILSDTLM